MFKDGLESKRLRETSGIADNVFHDLSRLTLKLKNLRKSCLIVSTVRRKRLSFSEFGVID